MIYGDMTANLAMTNKRKWRPQVFECKGKCLQQNVIIRLPKA